MSACRPPPAPSWAMDDGDRAAELARRDREAGLARALAGARREPSGPAGVDCIDCGVPIPPARRRAMPAARRCVECQALRDSA